MGSIPSPSSGEIGLGPISIHAYGLMLLLGIVAATWLTGRRWTGRWAFWQRPGRRPRLPRGHVGRARRDRRRAPLPRDHELEHGRRRVVGALRRLGGRPGRLGRHRRRRPRRRVGRPPRRRERLRVHGRGRARPPARAGDRPLGQLLQPGALREADRPALGESRSRSRTGRARTRSSRPSTRPSSTSRSGACSASASCSSSTGASPEAARALRPLRHVVLRRPLRHGAAANRRGARVLRPAPERLGVDRRLRARALALDLVAAARTRGAPRGSAALAPPEGPTMAIPKGRVR